VLYVVSHVNVTSLFGCCIMSVSMVALSSGRMLTTAVDGSLAAKVRNRLDGNLRLRNRQGAWEGCAWEEGGAGPRGRGLGPA